MRRGILGGTFDPPHIAHLFAGEAAYRDLGLDVVSFLPAGAPWQKAGRAVTPAAQRWEMVQLAVAGVDYFQADDREVRRDGWTYTADTLDSYPVDEDLVLILGADAARNLGTWHRHQDVLARATVAVLPRPGIPRSEVDWTLQGYRYSWLEIPELQLSGTELREWAAGGRSLRFLVPDAVWEYVTRLELYQGSVTAE